MTTQAASIEIDIHLLELRYIHTRVSNEQTLRRLRKSIERYGQLVPALVVKEQDKFVLIDGYLRLKALRACGKDCIQVYQQEGTEWEALITLLSKSNERQWEAIEQASIIQELRDRFGNTLEGIAKSLGRDKSWVKRRLVLIEELPEEIQQSILRGTVTTWAASRVLAPLARANMEDALKLVKKLEKEPLTTRELATLFNHYLKSNRRIRDRIIDNPGLFLKAKQRQEEESEACTVNQGPEGKWFHDINIICHMLRRSIKSVNTILHPGLDKDPLLWAKQSEKLASDLIQEIERRNHGNPFSKRSNPGDGSNRRQAAQHQPDTEDIT